MTCAKCNEKIRGRPSPSGLCKNCRPVQTDAGFAVSNANAKVDRVDTNVNAQAAKANKGK